MCGAMNHMGNECDIYVHTKLSSHITARIRSRAQVKEREGERVENDWNCGIKTLILWLIDDMTIAAGGGNIQINVECVSVFESVHLFKLV